MLIGWQVQTGLHLRVLEQVLVFAAHDERQPCKIREDDSIAVLPIQSHERPLFGVLVRLEGAFNDGHRPAQLHAVLPVASIAKRGEPLICVRLQHRGP